MKDEWLSKGIPAALMRAPVAEPAKEVSEKAAYTRPLEAEEMEVCEAILAGEAPRVAFRRLTGKTSTQALQRFLTHPEANVYLAARRAELRERVHPDVDPAKEWLESVREMAFFDPAEIVVEGLKCEEDILRLPVAMRRLINGWGYDKAGNFNIKFVDRKAALDMLARYWGLYQAERTNDVDAERELLTKVFWRYVMALHMHEGVTIAEAFVAARREPEKVQEWARAHNLIGPGKNEIVSDG